MIVCKFLLPLLSFFHFLHRLVHDRYDKRRAAALEIETRIKVNPNLIFLSCSVFLALCDFLQDLVTVTGDTGRKEIEQILNLLVSDYALSSQPNSRKGGLLGLAAAALALGPGVHRFGVDSTPL